MSNILKIVGERNLDFLFFRMEAALNKVWMAAAEGEWLPDARESFPPLFSI